MKVTTTLREKFELVGSLAVLYSVIFGRFLFGGGALVMSWVPFDQYPRFAFIARALKTGGSLLWTENILTGFPVYLSVWGEHLNPIALFLLGRMDFLTFDHWMMAMNTFLGSILLYYLGRMIGLTHRGSLFSSLMYGTSQWYLFYGTMLFFGNSFILMPLLFMTVIKMARGHIWYTPLLALLVVYGWFSVMVDVFFYITIALVFFAIFYPREDHVPENFSRKKLFGLVVLAILLGTSIATVKLAPAYVMSQLSARAEGVIEQKGFLASADSHGYIGPYSIITLLHPYFAVPFSTFVPFLRSADKLTFLNVGIVPLFLLAFLLISFREIVRRKKEFPFFAVLTVIFFVTFLMLVKYVPLFYLVHKLPLFKLFGGTGKWTFLTFFTFPLVLGHAFDVIPSLRDAEWRRKIMRRIALGALIVPISSVLVFGTFTLLRGSILEYSREYFTKNLYATATTGKPLEHYYKLIENSYDIVLTGISPLDRHLATSLIFIVVTSMLLLVFMRKNDSYERLQKYLLIALFFNALFMWQDYYKTVPRTVFTEDPAPVAYVKSQQSAKNPSRTFRLWAGLREYDEMGLDTRDVLEKNKLETVVLTQNYPMVFNVDFPSGHENLMSARHSRLSAEIGSERAPGSVEHVWVSNDTIPFPERLKRFESEKNRTLLSMMNVEYVFSSFPFDAPWQKVFESKETSAQVPVFVYRNPDVLPRAYFATTTIFVESDSEKAFEALLSIKNFRNATIIECDSPLCESAKGKSSPRDSLEILETNSGFMRMRIKNTYPRWVVYSESDLPTWEATVRPWEATSTPRYVPIVKANYLFQGVYVPAGDHELIFTYPGVIRQTAYALRTLLESTIR